MTNRGWMKPTLKEALTAAQRFSIEYGQTGYWGDQNSLRATKVHIVDRLTPACGSRITKKMIYYFCAGWVEPSCITCEKCKRLWENR